MTPRGRTTPASTSGSFRAQTGERSRVAIDTDVKLDTIAATYQHALNLWTGDEHDRLERNATNDLTEWIRARPEAVAAIDRAVARLTEQGRAAHAAHANTIEAALTATDPDTGMHPSTRKAVLRQALTETAENDNWTGARTIMATVIAARQHLAYHQQQTTDYQPPLHEIVSAVEHEPAFADLAGHTVPLAQAIHAHMHLRQQESGT